MKKINVLTKWFVISLILLLTPLRGYAATIDNQALSILDLHRHDSNVKDVKNFKEFLKEAENNDSKAQTNVAYCYFHGLGVQQNYDEAEKWLKKAMKNGDELAYVNLGMFYLLTNNYNKGLEIIKPLAEKGDPTAQANLGACYMNGWGVQQNFDEALKLLKPLSDIGNARALALTAFCHVQKINEAIKDMGTFAMNFKDSPDANSDEKTKALKEKIFTIDALLNDAKTWYKNIEQQGFKLPTDVQTKFNGFITEMEKLLKELDINELKK